MNRWIWILAVVMALVPACRKPKKVLTETEKRQVKDNTLQDNAKVEGMVNVGALFEDKIELVGYTLNKRDVEPGDTTKLTLYWKSLAPVNSDFKIFVHVDSKSRKTFDHYAIGNLYPTENWKTGEIVKDELDIALDKGFPKGPARIWVGFFDAKAWRDNQENVRLKIRNPGTTRSDNGDRLLVTSLLVGTLPVKDIKVKKASEAITVDGTLKEALWKGAFATAGKFYTTDGKPVPHPEGAQVAMTWDDEKLYLAFDITDTDLSSPYDKRDSTLWSGGKNRASDEVEFFFDPDADGKDYLELQISPKNVVFDAKFDSYRKPRWQDAISFNMELEHEVTVKGTVNDTNPDEGYTVEVAIPWKELPGMDKAPTSEDIFKVNFFRLSNSGTWALAWAPVGGDFHDMALAGIVRFVP